ncbi:peptidase M16 domain protein [Rhodomicrobium vannielii ATCC 17100]|uniref:Peptidase M16 domain protein n=2 Tax=Rhodomicrobium vannielii TaxID=1069 RepID=E3I832_RHOVT|nr:peptidase M16 domain protein [Rhodomicrobium vannielii ATCC 17100]
MGGKSYIFSDSLQKDAGLPMFQASSYGTQPCSTPSRSGTLTKIKLLGALLMALALSPLDTLAAAQTSSPARLAYHGTLDNGLEIVVVPDRRAPVVTHMVWYKVGAADEPLGKSGIAHFLEHLMFKGTDKIPAGEYSKIVARLGGQDNAFTAQDITAYFQRVAKDKLPKMMEMEADRMANLKLAENDVLTERKVILEERRSRVDNDPSSLLQEQMMASLYTAHPYHTPIIGWETEMKGLTREDAIAHYKKWYAPNNAVLVVTGDVEPEEVVRLAKETYGKIPANPAVGAPRKRPSEPEPVAEKRVLLRDGRVGKATLERYYTAPSFNTATNGEAEAMQLLGRIVGASNTSRIYNKLVREEKKASAASAWYSGLALDNGRFGFYAVAAGDNKLEDIEASIDAVIDEVIRNGVTDEELERAKTSEIANLVYSSDSQQSLAHTYGWSLATGRTVDDVEARSERLKAVKREDVQAVAAKYLKRKRSVTGYLIPEPSQVAKVDPRPASAGGTLH